MLMRIGGSDSRSIESVTKGASIGAKQCNYGVYRNRHAFIGAGLVQLDNGRTKRRHRNHPAERNTHLSQQGHLQHNSGIDDDGSLYHGLKAHAEALSRVSNHMEHIGQRLRCSVVYKRIKDGIKVVTQRITNLSTAEQIFLGLLGKLVYAFALPGFHMLSPYQLVPVNSGLGVDIGLETLVSIGSYYFLWKCMRDPEGRLMLNENGKITVPLIAAGLLGSFYLSGYAGQLVDNGMLFFSAMDLPVSVALQRSMRILLSHLSWVVIGAKMLNHVVPLDQTKTMWFTMNTKELWVYRALAGYFVSCSLYNITDILFNAADAVKRTLDADHLEGEEDITSNVLIEPTELIPTIIAAIGPCITAPWWEEMLYRVFVFKVLNIKLPRYLATATAALIFAVHHMNPRSLLQLFSLGVLWSLIEQGTNNIFISVAIHSMWNTRIMLGTLLGR